MLVIVKILRSPMLLRDRVFYWVGFTTAAVGVMVIATVIDALD